MKTILKLLITAALVILLSKILPGVTTTSWISAILVGITISLLNFIVRPILIALTLPITILSFGLFILVINACIILLSDWLIDGFSVDGFLWAMLFSILLALGRTILYRILDKDKVKK